MKTRYETFIANEADIWRYRFTWRGLYSDKAYCGINILSFLRDTNAQDELRGIKDATKFRTVVGKLAKKYVEWTKTRESHTENEYRDMLNFFVGAIGEFFFTYLFHNSKKILCEENDKIVTYDFNYVAPLLKNEKDFGIDLTGVVCDRESERNCVLQVKFWDSYSTEWLTTEVAQKAFCEGVLNKHIDSNEYKNVIICWLGDDSKISPFLKENKELYKHIIFIGRKALKFTISEANEIFWNGIVDKLTEIANS